MGFYKIGYISATICDRDTVFSQFCILPVYPLNPHTTLVHVVTYDCSKIRFAIIFTDNHKFRYVNIEGEEGGGGGATFNVSDIQCDNRNVRGFDEDSSVLVIVLVRTY